ncbi:MAG: cytochrome-c peroxidase [Terriglobales bacterium]
MNSKRLLSVFLLSIVAFGLLFLYARTGDTASVRPIGKQVTIPAPLGLPPVPIPADNPPTAETIDLGRHLYYEPMLSVDNTLSCASCHHPDAGFADPRPVSIGIGGKKGTRNSPPVCNATYFDVQFWDGRAPNLEIQAEGPVQNPVEMAHTLTGVEQKLSANPAYVAMFEKAYGPGPITYEKVEKAIATFERTIISGNSPFDRWYYGHDEHAMNESAKRGFKVFTDPKKGNCSTCHTIGEKYALFTDNKFHNIGIGAFQNTYDDKGRYEVTKNENDLGAFKTPSLRNIALTAPYFHDSSAKNLKDAVDYYIGGGNSNAHLDKEVHVLDFLSGEERADLKSFLESLTGELPKDVGPPPGMSVTDVGK